MTKKPHRATNHDVDDDGSPHKYFSMIPHTFVRGMKGQGLSLPARWLYVYLKSVAGENGECTRNTTTLAKEAQLGRGTIAGAKKELIAHNLITLVTRQDSYHNTDRIRIVDIWLDNMTEFSPQRCSSDEQQGVDCSSLEQCCSRDEQQVSPTKSMIDISGCSLHERGCSSDERGCSPHEPKKKLLRRSQEEDTNTPPTPPKGGKRQRKKRDEPISPEARIIMDHLIMVTETQFREPGLIQPCLNRGATVEECLMVIDWCAAIWSKRYPDQEANLNTSTPFRQSNFDRYRAAAEKWHAQGRPAYPGYHGSANGVPLRAPTDADILSPD